MLAAFRAIISGDCPGTLDFQVVRGYNHTLEGTLPSLCTVLSVYPISSLIMQSSEVAPGTT